MFIWVLILIIYFFLNYIYNMKNFLTFLIMIEFIIITILFFILLNNLNMWFYLIYLVFSVCESVLGMSLLVSMTFEFGHQKISLINLC